MTGPTPPATHSVTTEAGAVSDASEPTPTPTAPDVAPVSATPPLRSEELSCYFGRHLVVEGVTLDFPAHTITSIIGPSGCGKSTFIRALNRMHEAIPGARAEGRVLLHGHDVYARRTDPVAVRRSVGMVFQRPNPFPTRSIADNILAGPSFLRQRLSRADRAALVEQTLRGAGLWDEVKNRLGAPAGGLSGGQQQRLCIARALAVEPSVLLMDEPCSALDPQSTQRIEELMFELRERLTIVIVTHNMQQAARVSDHTAFFTIATEGEPGRLVEAGPTTTVFGAPRDPQTEAYISGRFG